LEEKYSTKTKNQKNSFLAIACFHLAPATYTGRRWRSTTGDMARNIVSPGISLSVIGRRRKVDHYNDGLIDHSSK
jgi:hypothetical protein